MLMQHAHSSRSHNKLCRGFTKDSKYIYCESNTHYQMFRTEDRSTLCTLPKEQVQIVESWAGTKTLEGFIDLRSRKFYPWSIETMVHLSQNNVQANLVPSDLVTHKAHADNLILGLPMPALYPSLLRRCMEETNYTLLGALNQYTLAPQFVNILHFLVVKNRDMMLRYYFSDLQNCHKKYFAVSESPLTVAKKRSSCSYKIINFLSREKQDYQHLFIHFCQFDLHKILVTENCDFIQSLIATNTEELPNFRKETLQLKSKV